MKKIILVVMMCFCYLAVNAMDRNNGQFAFTDRLQQSKDEIMRYEPVPDGWVRVRGWVTGLANGQPVPDCTMSIHVEYMGSSFSFSGDPQTQSTDSNGYFCFYISKRPLFVVLHVLYLGGVAISYFNYTSNGDANDCIYNISL